MRNIFSELGKSDSEIKHKLDTAFQSLFYGNTSTEKIYFETSNDLAYIVDIGHNDIRSEGMSYGMFVTALLDKQNEFEKLWNFAKRYMQHSKGPAQSYFSWQVSTADFSMMDPGAAPDGEEYIAAALLIAASRFNRKDYQDEAISLINAMAHKEPSSEIEPMIDRKYGMVRFSPVIGNDFTDPSYHTLAFYQWFAEATDRSFWESVLNKSRLYLKSAQNSISGLYPDYSEFDGTPKKTAWHPVSHCFSGDAWRVIMNIAIDYALNKHDPSQQESIIKTLSFFEERRPYLADYSIDGGLFPTPPREATVGLIAMNGAATIALPPGHPYISSFATDLWNTEPPTGTWRYYDGLLYLIGLLACSGKIKLK